MHYHAERGNESERVVSHFVTKAMHKPCGTAVLSWKLWLCLFHECQV